MAVISALVVFASIAVFASVYATAGHQTPVLIVTRTIEQGQRITGSALGQASASISGGVSPIPVSDASELSGERAAVTVPSGSLLTTRDITRAPAIAAGDAVVGLALKPGQLPTVGLAAGDRVMIIQTASPGTPLSSLTGSSADSSSESESESSSTTAGDSPDGAVSVAGGSTGVLVSAARVFDVESPAAGDSADDSLLVSVEVATTLAADVSTAAAADQVSLVLLPDAPSSPTAGATGGIDDQGAVDGGSSS